METLLIILTMVRVVTFYTVIAAIGLGLFNLAPSYMVKFYAAATSFGSSLAIHYILNSMFTFVDAGLLFYMFYIHKGVKWR